MEKKIADLSFRTWHRMTAPVTAPVGFHCHLALRSSTTIDSLVY